MLESIFSERVVDTNMTMPELLIAMLTALALGVVISLVYMRTHKNHNPSQSFALTLVMLPAVITVIILLVGSNIARAFSLAGAFSIIRFRSAPGDPKDITYVLFTMAVGLAAGMGFIGYAVIVALVLCVTMIALEALHFGRPKGLRKLLKITVPENLDYENAFDGVLKRYVSAYTLRQVKTAELGSLFELQYSITTRDGVNEKDFIDELRCRNGNLNITLLREMPQGEFA